MTTYLKAIYILHTHTHTHTIIQWTKTTIFKIITALELHRSNKYNYVKLHENITK